MQFKFATMPFESTVFCYVLIETDYLNVRRIFPEMKDAVGHENVNVERRV
jgi:hypothetical protein